LVDGTIRGGGKKGAQVRKRGKELRFDRGAWWTSQKRGGVGVVTSDAQDTEMVGREEAGYCALRRSVKNARQDAFVLGTGTILPWGNRKEGFRALYERSGA